MLLSITTVFGCTLFELRSILWIRPRVYATFSNLAGRRKIRKIWIGPLSLSDKCSGEKRLFKLLAPRRMLQNVTGNHIHGKIARRLLKSWFPFHLFADRFWDTSRFTITSTLSERHFPAQFKEAVAPDSPLYRRSPEWAPLVFAKSFLYAHRIRWIHYWKQTVTHIHIWVKGCIYHQATPPFAFWVISDFHKRKWVGALSSARLLSTAAP